MRVGYIIIIGATVLISTSARAETEAPGTIAIAGSLALTGGSISGENRPTSRSGGLTALPTIDVFVGGGLTLGAAAGVSHWRASTPGYPATSWTQLQPGLQVGYFTPIGEHAAFWPVMRASYGVTWAPRASDGASGDTTTRAFELSLTPNILLRPTKTFFVRLAPGVLAYRATIVSPNAVGAFGALGVGGQFAIGVGVML